MNQSLNNLSEAYSPSTTMYHIENPINSSLLNFVPSTIGSTFQDTTIEEETSDSSKDPSISFELEEYKLERDERCEELWRAFKNEAECWTTHRFSLHEWDLPETYKKEPVEIDNNDDFDGYLTKEMIAPGLSKLERSPIFYHYAYIKCILREKRLIDIDELKYYQYLQYVDVSRNKLTTLKALGNLPFLKYLDASHNHLGTILDFKAPYFLTTVNLSHNKIKVMNDMSEFWSITDLNLSHNGIKIIDGLLELTYLTMLNLSFNRIEVIENLNHLRIQFLFLQNNQIKSLEDNEKAMLKSLNNIRMIDLSHNQITSLKMFESVENLECLEIPNNDISKLIDIYYLRNLKYLNKVNLLGNPVTNLRRYVEVCITNIRNLVYLDGEKINYDFWLQKISTKTADVTQTASRQRLKLLILEQLNQPQMWDWILPYDSPPLAVIVLVGLQGCKRAYLARKFQEANENVVVGIPYTTKPRLPDEIEGDHFYYVSDEQFLSMLKKGMFLTYQEDLGYRYGFAHSELKKAENGILLLYAQLVMSLSIKSRFLNTKLVLTLPSTETVYLKNLKELYAIRLLDLGTLKIVSAPTAAKYCRLEFDEMKKISIEHDVKTILNDLITQIEALVFIPPSLNRLTYAEQSSECWQPWETNGNGASQSQDRLSSSKVIEPLNPDNDNNKHSEENGHEEKDSERRRRSSPSKYVSFTVERIRRITDDENDDYYQQNWLCNEENGSEAGTRQLKENIKTFEEDMEDTKKEMETSKTSDHHKQVLRVVEKDEGGVEQDLDKVRPGPVGSLSNNYYAECYDILYDDETINSLFTSELNRRQELLELHWSMPGLFRELLFSDYEQESLEKLKNLVKDITIFDGVNHTPMFNFEDDENFKSVTNEKLKMYFKNLQREMSTSEKQAAEYIQEENSHICGLVSCNNPACPPF